MATPTITLTRKDFASDQTVRWCPGCGDYAILATVQKTFARFGWPREKFVIVSGIGCSSRFPYYMNVYGFHTIHGRAPTVATGVKLANPELSVWVVTGDGDGLSIGGNHLLHAARRNVDINVLLFNNAIYGLTKGQLSPTSPQGMRTKSSPYGSVEPPVNPVAFALAAGATFVARTVDVFQSHMSDMMYLAGTHKGFSFIEILQNCVIFNHGMWFGYTERDRRHDHIIYLEPGKPMLFGKDHKKGLVFRDGHFHPVLLGKEYSEDDVTIHDPSSLTQAFALAQLRDPLPIGIFYQVRHPTYEEGLYHQIEEVKKQKGGQGRLEDLFHSGDTWVVE